MTDRYLEILRDSGHAVNYIPSGRQLPRTPPLMDVTRHLDFCNIDPSEDCEKPPHNMEAGARGQDNLYKTFDFNTPEAERDDPESLLKGMKGYQMTPGDLEFIKRMKEEKHTKKLQGDLEEVQRLLKKEMMATELVCASREKVQAELKKFPSCEELTEWVKVVFKMTSPSTELTDLDAKSLLAMVTKENLQRAMDEKRIELTRKEKMVASKRKKEIEERGQLERLIASKRLGIQGLMNQLKDLKSELDQHEEAYKALEMQINSQKAPDFQVEADTSEELHATKSQVKRRGKEREAVKSTEKLQDTTNQSKSTMSKHTDCKTDNQNTLKDDHANKNSERETLKAKQMSGAAAERPAKPVKAVRVSRKKVEEQQSNQVSVHTVRGRRKPPGTTQTAASQLKDRGKVKTEEDQSASQQAASSSSGKKAAGDVQERAQNAGLRRSKRIASRR
ncbi:uncharacterized protein LOC123973041 isoform X1 [Micropterus dolomieu]|uniref:uncharacterized protein LOC123973041 isoform X1 n=1 Tax=Micropterus dolomieu TaxID=147949 RepID=UPI001E8E673B|nr:uncharacterized protein LOC123973041 isoform X1 [Micropterus dolomieu]